MREAEQSPVIDVQDVSFGYEREDILRHITFQIREGDYVALTGANGTGKSTLLKLLLGQLMPRSGRILLWGRDTHAFREWPWIGYVPQVGSGFYRDFPATAREVVLLGLQRDIGLLRRPRREHRERAMAALREVGMAGAAGQQLGTLSGGQLQRVMIARTLVAQPKLLLLDEPTAGIDTEARDQLFELLGRLNAGGIPLLMVTHDVAEIRRRAKRMLALDDLTLREEA